MDQSIGSMAAGIVVTAVVQEGVSRVVTHMLGKRERTSMEENLERLEWAHSKLELALERSSKLPITDVSLQRQRRVIKRVCHQCDELLSCKRQVLDDDHVVAELGVTTTATQSSSFPVILSAVRSASSFFGMNKRELSHSVVRRFESFADKASEFMRDVESGCTLSHYRFFNPLITQLLQGNQLQYEVQAASRTQEFQICSLRSEEHGVVARLQFHSCDPEISAKCFDIVLVLRLSENTNIVGIAIQCLQSLGPQFKSLAQVAIGELSQIPTQDLSTSRSYEIDDRVTSHLYEVRPDPLCCGANVPRACADNVIPSELSDIFPEQLLVMRFTCIVSAFDQYNVQNSADEAEINVVNGWPLLRVKAYFLPHVGNNSCNVSVCETIDEQREDMNGTSLQRMRDMVLTDAIACFIRQPELTMYQMDWKSPHGAAVFTVEKPGDISPEPIQVQDARPQGEQQREDPS